ncbi:MAG: hypothetical protein EON58_09205 [Alphaproteobacteria bacterium]|nr:MAG: hypothetical protein EON58_09205 [Alphaproteobacteria bacterium]
MSGFETVDLKDLDEMDDSEVSYVVSRVEQMFGPCHPDVEIEGVYFYDRRYPGSIYPLPYSQFRLAVCLPEHQKDDPMARLVHLSHELVHCLTPNGMPSYQATILEEGLAEHAKIYLAVEHFQEEVPDYDFRDMLTGDYRAAFYMIEELIGLTGLEVMRDGVKSLRIRTGLPFARITADQLAEVFPKAPRSLLERLSQRFHDSNSSRTG